MTIQPLSLDRTSLKEISSSLGATDCKYFECLHPSLGKLFIKRGEKVETEILRYKELEESGNLGNFLEPVGTLDGDSLVLPFATEPRKGFNLVDSLWQYPDSADHFARFQTDVFEDLCTFYRQTLNHTHSSQQSCMFGHRVISRINGLDSISELTLDSSFGESVTVGSLLNQQICLAIEGNNVEAPSLRQMVANLDKSLFRLYSYQGCTIHADPQPSNIIASNQELKIIDLSDMRTGEDAAWDIGKWMNYVARFHGIVKERNQSHSLNESFPAPHALTVNYLRDQLVAQVADSLGASREEVRNRSILAEFVVNLSTLRRHLLRYPKAAKTVLIALVETYNTAVELDSI